MRWHQKMALQILALKISQKSRQNDAYEAETVISRKNSPKQCFHEKNRQIDANYALRVASKYGIKIWHQFIP